MVLITRFHKKCRIAHLKIAILAIAIAALFLPNIEGVKSVGDNIYTLYVNGIEIGKVDGPDEADHILVTARRDVTKNSDSIVFIETESELVGEEVLYGTTDDFNTMAAKVVGIYLDSVIETVQHSYTLKIDDYSVNVASSEDVVEILNAAIDRYDVNDEYTVTLEPGEERQTHVLVPEIIKTETVVEQDSYTGNELLGDEGITKAFDTIIENLDTTDETDFNTYEYGITDISFADEVEVIESYLPESQITELQTAIDDVTKEKEEKTTYEVVSGDTLSKIASKTGISIDELVELNDSLESKTSIIRVGDNLTITVPQPELSVSHEELVYYEGTYEADVQYIYNDSWYTTTEVTRQEPSSGYHKAVEKITYLNNEVVSTEVVYEEVLAEAVPKIVEKGTKIPPTYIKPISGGTITDYFGYRKAPMAGASTYHRGIDWGIKTGSTVVASCGGTVTTAGWVNSYGYCIIINHPDGRQTLYAHLSKILVSKGEYVSQGQKIALTGNTGNSTGPHLHFELRINGTAVNPLKYIN